MNEQAIAFLNKRIMVCPQCFKEKCAHTYEPYESIEIDASMQEVLEILNQKRYFTVYHCGGHTDRLSISIYIMFAGFLEFPKDVGMEIGEGWEYFPQKHIIEYKLNKKESLNIKYTSKLSLEEKATLLYSKQSELLAWAKSLKPREGNTFTENIMKGFSSFTEF